MRIFKIFFKSLLRPSKAALGIILLMGFLGGLVFWGAFNTGLEATGTEEFCSSCHAPIVAEIKETIHYSNRSGVHAVCADCHVPHDFTDKIIRKVQASREVLAFTMGAINTQEKFDAKRLEFAKREWKRMKDNDSQECRNCHQFKYMDYSAQAPMSVKQHSKYLASGEKTCIDCHKGIAHKLPNMSHVEGWQGRK